MLKRILSPALAVLLCGLPVTAGPRLPRIGRPLDFQNSARVHDLIRAGNMYLSVTDALKLAIENNLDVEMVRFAMPVADTELLRAQGGGTLRGQIYTIGEIPAGVGGPLSPVVLTTATAGRTSASSVGTNALELGTLAGSQTNLSMLGSVSQSNGTALPAFDPSVTGQLNWQHQTTPQTNTVTSGISALVANVTTANAGVSQGFSSGASAALSFTNNRQDVNSIRTTYSPYTASTFGLTVTQPLLRGFGPSLNRRFIRVAANTQKIGRLLFQQQLTVTVYGVIRLYTDFVALYENLKVKEQSLALAEKLLSDTQAQVNEGTLAPIEVTRAKAVVFSSRQDVINSRGQLDEQAAILKNVLTRRGNEDPEVRAAAIIPTGPLTIPARDEVRPMQDLISEALQTRADYGQAGLQIESAQIALQGARNATRPQVDLVGVMQNNGLAGAANPLASTRDSTFLSGYGGVLEQIFARKYPTYGIGVQVTLPIRNRVAEADLARDELQVKQFQIRHRQMQNQIRLEVEDALIAMRRSRASYEAAAQARILQQQSLEAEQAKFAVGASTAYFVIQYESMLAQTKSTEVAAKSAYVKARAALQRATGTILDQYHVSVDDAYKGKL